MPHGRMFGDLSSDSCKRSQERKHPCEAASSGVLTPGLRPELSPRFVPRFRRRGTRPPPAWTGAQLRLLPSPEQASPHLPRPHELGISPGCFLRGHWARLPRSHLEKPRPLVYSQPASLWCSEGFTHSQFLSLFMEIRKIDPRAVRLVSPCRGGTGHPEQGPRGPSQGSPAPPPPAGRQCPHHAHRVPGPEREPQPGGRVVDVVPSLSPRRQPMPCLISFDN